MLVSVSHSMSISPVTEYVAPTPVDTYTALSSVIEYVAVEKSVMSMSTSGIGEKTSDDAMHPFSPD